MIKYNKNVWKQRLLIGTPVTGLVRIEWAERRWSQVLPTNWGLVDLKPYLNASMPMRYQVSDAQNLIVKEAVEKDFEWVFLWEHDNIAPADAFLRINKYMKSAKYPVISGLYFTKSVPPEPIIYRGRGNSYFDKWKLGDRVMVDGIPTGCILIHMSLIKAMWDESPEYRLGDTIVRRVFEEPARIVFNKEFNSFVGEFGTSDLAWCTRVIREKFLAKAGWDKIAKMRYPFLCDTSFFWGHMDETGRNFPLEMPKEFIPPKGYKPQLLK